MRSEILLIVAAVGLSPVVTRAQEPGGAVACPTIENDHDRLACYDRAMRGAVHTPEPAAAPAATTTTAPANTGSVAAAAAATAVVAPAAGAAAPAPTATATPSSTISTSPHNARNTHAGTPGQPPAPPTFDPVTGAPTGIIPIVVLSTRSRPGLGTEFTTDKGGVWVQTESKTLNLPSAPFNAELQPGSFGSTFLVVPDRKLGIRVRNSDK